MINLSRRALLVGSGAAVVCVAIPTFAQQAVMPSVRTVKVNGINLADSKGVSMGFAPLIFLNQ